MIFIINFIGRYMFELIDLLVFRSLYYFFLLTVTIEGGTKITDRATAAR